MSSCVAVESRFAGVTSMTPVSMRRSTGLPRRWSTIAVTPRYPMRMGFCTTTPSSCRLRTASTRMVLASKPTNRTLPALPMSCSASSMPIVDDSLGLFHRAHQRTVIERGEHDAADALAEEPLHDLHLLLPVVLAERSLPYDAHRRALGRELARRLDRAGVDALPELVRRAFGDDGDGQLLVGAGAAAARQQRGAEQRERKWSHSVTTPLM